MGRMKSKNLKRMALGLGAATFMCASAVFSATPVMAAENETAETAQPVQEITVEPENKLVFDEVEKAYYSDLSTLSDVELYAGTETWYTGSGLGGDYTFTNNNTTPVKTMGNSGTLRISGSFYGADGYASASPIKLTVRIQSTSGTVLSSTIAVDELSGATPFSVSCPVSQGQKIQLFFDASSVANPPGIYRKAHVTYYRYLY